MERLLTFVFPLDSVSFNELRIDCFEYNLSIYVREHFFFSKLVDPDVPVFKCCRLIVLVAKIKLEGLIPCINTLQYLQRTLNIGRNSYSPRYMKRAFKYFIFIFLFLK